MYNFFVNTKELFVHCTHSTNSVSSAKFPSHFLSPAYLLLSPPDRSAVPGYPRANGGSGFVVT